MTREESEKYIKSKMCNDCSVHLGGGKCSDNCKVIEAIKALEQEPCDNAISRQAVLALAKEECDTAIIPYRRFVKDINALPPVTPQPKTGHWIEHPTEEDYSVCSRCGIGCKRMEHGKNADGTKYIDIYSYNFCPYCGARMESEDNE